ncbi:hypothetical protein OIO03_24510, partial [Acinetobacter baumannii]|nr:hypothetical protein [Acinetobacter baumannii]MCW1766762.1 hypothetical protein [Acinetobacter baumannii]
MRQRFRMNQEFAQWQRREDGTEQKYAQQDGDKHAWPKSQQPFENECQNPGIAQPAQCDKKAADAEKGHHGHSAHHVCVQPPGRLGARDVEVMAEY